MTNYKKVKLKKRWRHYAVGAVVGPIQPNVAKLLMARGIADEYVDPPAKKRRTRKNGEDPNRRPGPADHDG